MDHLTDDQKDRSNYVDLEHIFSDVRQLSVYSHAAVRRPADATKRARFRHDRTFAESR
jgi:hypothetical protein